MIPDFKAWLKKEGLNPNLGGEGIQTAGPGFEDVGDDEGAPRKRNLTTFSAFKAGKAGQEVRMPNQMMDQMPDPKMAPPEDGGVYQGMEEPEDGAEGMDQPQPQMPYAKRNQFVAPGQDMMGHGKADDEGRYDDFDRDFYTNPWNSGPVQDDVAQSRFTADGKAGPDYLAAQQDKIDTRENPMGGGEPDQDVEDRLGQRPMPAPLVEPQKKPKSWKQWRDLQRHSNGDTL